MLAELFVLAKKKKKSLKQPKSPPTCGWLHDSFIHSVIVKKTDIFLRVISIYLTHISPRHRKQKLYIAEEHFSTVNSIANVQKRWLTWFWYYHSRKVVSSWHDAPLVNESCAQSLESPRDRRSPEVTLDESPSWETLCGSGLSTAGVSNACPSLMPSLPTAYKWGVSPGTGIPAWIFVTSHPWRSWPPTSPAQHLGEVWFHWGWGGGGAGDGWDTPPGRSGWYKFPKGFHLVPSMTGGRRAGMNTYDYRVHQLGLNPSTTTH